MAVIEFTSAPAGTGKSYVRCARFLVDEFLPLTTKKHISNFPVNIDEVSKAVASKLGQTPEQVAERIEILPEAELVKWREGSSGPWEYFAGRSIDGCHIAIDEVHTVCGRHHKPAHRHRWQTWLGEIRHEGATVEFITQSEKKVAKEIDSEAGMRRSLVDMQERRDPFFSISMRHWYEMRAAFLTGEYTAAFKEVEFRDVAGKWVQNHVKVWVRDPAYFRFYNSFSASSSGGKGSAAEVREYQKRSKVSLLLWFFSRNMFSLSTRGAIIGVLVWLLVLGGHKVVIAHFVASVAAHTAKGKNAKPTDAAADGVASKDGAPKAKPGGKLSKIVGHAEGSVPEAKGVVNATQVVQLITDLKTTRVALEASKQLALDNAAKLDQQKIDSDRLATIVALVPSGVWLRSGDFIPIGERLENGLFSGEVLAAVDLRGRAAVFASGRRVRLRLQVSPGAAAKEETRSGVPGDVPSVASAGVGATGGAIKAPAGVPGGKGVAPSRGGP